MKSGNARMLKPWMKCWQRSSKLNSELLGEISPNHLTTQITRPQNAIPRLKDVFKFHSINFSAAEMSFKKFSKNRINTTITKTVSRLIARP